LTRHKSLIFRDAGPDVNLGRRFAWYGRILSYQAEAPGSIVEGDDQFIVAQEGDAMSNTKPPAATAETVKDKKPPTPADRWTGHALDGSQQMDIVEEQMYANEPGPTKDQPLVQPPPPK
jgi:hypothetical protein